MSTATYCLMLGLFHQYGALKTLEDLNIDDSKLLVNALHGGLSLKS